MDEQNTPVYVPQPNKSKKWIIIAIAAIVALVAVVGIAGSAIANSNPTAMLGNAVEKTANTVSQNNLYSTLVDVLTGGSIEIKGDIGEFAESSLGYSDIDAMANVKFFFDFENLKAAVKASGSVEGAEILDAAIYVNPSEISVASSALLGKKSYGINLENFEKNFEKSIFADEDSDYYIEVDLEELEESVAMLEQNKKLEKDATKVVEDAFEKLAKLLSKYAELEKSDGSLTFGDKTVKTNVVTVTIDEEAFYYIVCDFVKYLDSNKKLEKFIESYADVLATSYMIDPEDLLDEYRDGIDELLENIEDSDPDDIGDFKFVLTANISKSGKELVALESSCKVEDEKVFELNAEFGPTWKNLTDVKVEFEAGSNAFEFVYEVEQNTKSEFAAEAKMSVTEEYYSYYDGEYVTDSYAYFAEINWDKKAGDLEISAGEDGEEYIAFEGNLKVDGKTITFVPEAIVSDGYETEISGISVIIKTSDKMPDGGKYTDILTMTESDIEALVSDIEDAAEELTGALQGVMG